MILEYIPYVIAFLTGVLLTLFIILISDQVSMKKDLKRASGAREIQGKRSSW